MNKRFKAATAVVIAAAMVSPAATMLVNAQEKSSDVKIDIEKNSVVLGSKSKASVKFKEDLKADSITLKFICYDMPLEAELKYNASTKAYEGVIEFNKDPEYLNVWELKEIKVNSASPYSINREELKSMGMDTEESDVVQECFVDLSSVEGIQRYSAKTSAPVKSLIGDNRYGTAIKISKEGWKSADKVIIVNRNAGIEGILATPLASIYNAPILLSSKDVVPSEIISEIKRLGAKEIVVVGDESYVSKKAVSKLETSGAKVRRISGSNRHDLSLNIAKEIDKHIDVDGAYITNAYEGEIDALTIAAKAGQDKKPIILTDKNSMPKATYDWLESEDLKDAYFIGGTKVISNTVVNDINDITSSNVSSNRVWGNDRHETNAAVMKKFYNKEQENIFVAKSDELIDALTCGALAAKKKSPILINSPKRVSEGHEETLKTFKANNIYQVGGGMASSVMSSIAYSLSKHNDGGENTPSASGKTVVLDAGHGGSDSGAVSGSRKEKDYTLTTTLGAAEYLRKQNVNVVLTRDSDKTLALPERSALSNKIKPTLFTSIHYNSSNGKGHGVEVFYKVKDKNGGYTKTLANNILDRMVEHFNLTNRGAKTRVNNSGTDYLHVIREVKAPSVLVECAFIDNNGDMKEIENNGGTAKMGEQIAKGIVDTIK